MERKINKPFKGISTNNSPQFHNSEWFRFALNVVMESEEGDIGSPSRENSNQDTYPLPTGYILLGREYLLDNSVVIFSVKRDETTSEIGIIDKDNNYTTVVNADLGFKISNQIRCVFRMRRGCGRVIYFVDGVNPPRYFNLDQPRKFKYDIATPNEIKDPYLAWDIIKFNLISSYKVRPVIDRFEIEETGNIPAGSYNFAIQYLDADLNPTEFIEVYDTIIIYHDNTISKEYEDIEGSTNEISVLRDYGKSTKSIRVIFKELDEDFPYYRLAILEANSGTGTINKVYYTSEISTTNKVFLYTGSNAEQIGTEEEVSQIKTIIDKVKYIESINNRLVLLNSEENDINYCKLQKYASKIKSNLKIEYTSLNNINEIDNQKRGQVHTEKIGYQPGEIYPFNIHYIFEDNTVSPGCHIPGRNPSYSFIDIENNIYDMSTDNVLENTLYRKFEDCNGNSFWGKDSQGESLKDKNVRHHRFPLRSEVNELLEDKDKIKFIEETTKKVAIGNNNIYQISLNITSEVNPEWCLSPEYYSFSINVYYTIKGEQFHKTIVLVKGNEIDTTNFTNSLNYWLVDIGEIDENSISFEVDDSGEIKHNVTASLNFEHVPPTYKDISDFRGTIFGIKFSNIQKPDLEDTNGKEVIGYIITRPERDEENKTILDTGVFLPIMKGIQRASIPVVESLRSTGLLNPYLPEGNIEKNMFAILHPEHKFKNKNYSNTTKIIQEGSFKFLNKDLHVSHYTIEDVQPGTSYDSSRHKSREKDSDGFSFHGIARETELYYEEDYELISDNLSEDDNVRKVKDFVYLNPLYAHSFYNEETEKTLQVYNLSSDNKIGIVNLTKNYNKTNNSFPYVILKKELSDPYANYNNIPYFKQAFKTFEDEYESIEVFSGDSYISSMKYLSSSYFDTSIVKRSNKSAIVRYVFGLILIVVGTSLGVAGLAIAAIGVLLITSGYELQRAQQIYEEEYKKGLENTITDYYGESIFVTNRLSAKDGGDDELQYFFDCLSNLWFESQINMNWRIGYNSFMTDFMSTPIGYNKTYIENYTIDKATLIDPKADGGRSFLGYIKPEIYELNNDYLRRERQKYYFLLPIEYECCSKCRNKYPHRIFWSEQSFVEELTDNFKTFLPNNYRDIEGNTGNISGVFTIQGNLFILTEECLWHLPQNYQERVTGEIVSYIGSGEFFGLPPRKIVDDNTGKSAGSRYNNILKTPYGVLIISEKQKQIFLFNGEKLDEISAIEEFSWFKNNMESSVEKEFYKINGENYPYSNNTSNPYGTGYIAAFDPKRQRILITKKDFIFKENFGNDYNIYFSNDNLIVFKDYKKTIEERESNGWDFVGIEDCQMKFQKISSQTFGITNFTPIPNNTDIHVVYDTSGSFGGFDSLCTEKLRNIVLNWYQNFKSLYPEWQGQIIEHQDGSERWLRSIYNIRNLTYANRTDEDLQKNQNILLINFINEASTIYHPMELKEQLSITAFQKNNIIDDFNLFGQAKNCFNTFNNIVVPIVFTSKGCCNSDKIEDAEIFSERTKAFLQHLIGAYFSYDDITVKDINTVLNRRNYGFSDEEWDKLITSLQGNNPYPNEPLRRNNIKIVVDKFSNSDEDIVFSTNEFNDLVGKYLIGNKLGFDKAASFPITIYEYENGTLYENPNILNLSWTRSFSLKFQSWSSFHSYLPNMYINLADNYCSWNYSRSNVTFPQIPIPNYIVKYNRPYHYGVFNGIQYPMIFEYISNESPTETKVFNSIKFNTTVKKYSSDFYENIEIKNKTFTNLILYNSRQCSGIINLFVNNPTTNYLENQVKKLSNNSIIVSKSEEDWNINGFKDYKIDINAPIFTIDPESLQDTYYIDKILTNNIDFNKDWNKIENFRDKYLVIRFIFNNFASENLIFNYSLENVIISPR